MSDNSLNMVFNLDGFERIDDIIFFDQPILTHLIKNGRDYFKYLIDSGDNYDLFLLLEIDKQSLIDYILGKIPLYSIIVNNKNIGTIFKEDFRGLIIDSYAINPNKMLDDYLPDEDSFLSIDYSFNSYYRELVDSYNQGLYLQELRSRAYYLKFEPTDPKYRNTIGFIELSNNLLDNVTSSFRSFAKADFQAQFKDIIGDYDKLNSTFGSLTKHIDPRVVDVSFNSFEIGIAADNVMKYVGDKHLKEWAVEVVDKFKNIVLDVDINDKDAEKIISRYSYEDRKNIFNPLILIINNKNVNFKIKDNKKAVYKKYTMKKEIRAKIVPDLPKEIKVDKDLELVNFTAVIDKNAKTKKTRINPEKSLFSTMDNTTAYITNENFENQGFSLDEKINIPVRIESQRNYIKLSTEYQGKEFTNEIHSDDLNQALHSLVKQIATFLKLG